MNMLANCPPSPPRPPTSTLASDRTPLLKPWSAKDEAELRDAQRRIDEATARRSVAVDRVVSVLNACFPNVDFSHDDARDAIGHAEQIRDALAPFDSGVRPASEQAR